jgi:hypothetical protein
MAHFDLTKLPPLPKHLEQVYNDLMKDVNKKMEARMGLTDGEKRFCAFVERFVLERASTFRVGFEDEDLQTCLLQAKSAYRRVAALGRGFAAEAEVMSLRVQDEQAPTTGATGATGPGWPQDVKWKWPKMLGDF